MFQRRSVQRSNISIFKGNSGPQNPKFLIGPATNIQGKHTNTQGNTSQKKRKNNRQQGQLNPRPQKKLFIIGKSFKAIQGRRRGNKQTVKAKEKKKEMKIKIRFSVQIITKP